MFHKKSFDPAIVAHSLETSSDFQSFCEEILISVKNNW